MSMHPSLKVKSSLLRTRSVWTRVERLEALKQSGDWKAGDSVYGLRKVRTQFKSKGKKK